jgi:hypothetical protein
MKNLLKKVFNNKLRILLWVLILVFITYLTFPDIRCFLIISNIDPDFIVGFLTAMALVLSLIQNNKDKRYSYNLRLGESMEEKGVRIIGKLLSIKHAAYVFSQVIPQYKESIDSGIEFRDQNKIGNHDEISGPDIELIAAFMDMYFPSIKEKWNVLMDKMSELATMHSNVQMNYSENLDLIKKKTVFQNNILDELNSLISKSKELEEYIDKTALEIRDEIVTIINEYKLQIRNNMK